MGISYIYDRIRPQSHSGVVHHQILDAKVRAFIANKNRVQKKYYTFSNEHYIFLYLDNGDRIDIKVNL